MTAQEQLDSRVKAGGTRKGSAKGEPPPSWKAWKFPDESDDSDSDDDSAMSGGSDMEEEGDQDSSGSTNNNNDGDDSSDTSNSAAITSSSPIIITSSGATQYYDLDDEAKQSWRTKFNVQGKRGPPRAGARDPPPSRLQKRNFTSVEGVETATIQAVTTVAASIKQHQQNDTAGPSDCATVCTLRAWSPPLSYRPNHFLSCSTSSSHPRSRYTSEPPRVATVRRVLRTLP